jgi:transcriptional regulator with XRE-family HTH domain
MSRRRNRAPLTRRSPSVAECTSPLTSVASFAKIGVGAMHRVVKKKDTTPRNQNLGEYVRERRLSLGLGYRDVADTSGLHYSYWNKLENGQYEQPAPKYLRIIAETLEVPVEDLLALAGYDLPERLPSFTPYLRAKYELPPEAVADLERYFDLLRNFYGIPKDQPVFPPKPKPPRRSARAPKRYDSRRAA